MRTKDELAARRERVQRLVAKRPTVTVEVTYAPSTIARNQLINLLINLLDEQRRQDAVPAGRGCG